MMKITSQLIPTPRPRNIDEFETEIREASTAPKKKVSIYEQKRIALGFHNSFWRSFGSRVMIPLILGWCRLRGLSKPVVVVLTVNSNCNWNCSYCYGDYPNKGTEQNLSTDQLIKLIDELSEMGCRYMIVHGGEALLRKDIGYIIDYIKVKRIYVCLVTNGQLFPRRIEELRNIDNLTISLDGRRENNDLNRGIGTYDHAITAIKLGLNEGFKVRVQCTLTLNNKGDIEYMAELAKELKVPVSFSILFKTDFTKHDDPLALSADEIRQCLQKIRKLKQKGYPLFTSEANLSYALRWPYERFNKLYLMKEEVPKDFKPIKCHYGQLKFHLEGDGRIMPCTIMSSNSFDGKNVKDSGARAAIKHVQDTNNCVACPHLTQNEWNLLMDMAPKTIGTNALEQLKELTRFY